MQVKTVKWLLAVCLLLSLTACGNKKPKTGNLDKVGLLVSETVNDQVWGTIGYKGMLKIQSDYNIDFYYKEGIDSQALTEKAVEEFSHKEVNLVFGHGKEYADYFNKIADDYPDIHFVSFNGDANVKNTTSLKFESHAMGFFGGMTAAHASKTEKIGVIATHKWQPEVKGFVEGAAFENKDLDVFVEYVGDWDDRKLGLERLDRLLSKGVDVVYPAGDGYNVPVIEELKMKGIYAIGYVSDQSELGGDIVLTSTIQNVDTLYLLVARRFAEGTLQSGNLHFDFQDGVISLGTFSPVLDKSFVDKINQYVEQYKKTGILPDQKEER